MSKFFFDDAVTTPVDVALAPTINTIQVMHLVNTTGATAYLQVFNHSAASVTLGVTAPVWVVRLGASESLVLPLPETVSIPLNSAVNGVSIAGTTTPGGAVTAAISVGLA